MPLSGKKKKVLGGIDHYSAQDITYGLMLRELSREQAVTVTFVP